ncbi:MAG: UdgX family uracil-DNA binding protein [Hyphomicrobium sp.]|nr:UdgX family uracil-DNA binding protein [Hyphomicrobium sp.]
MTDFVVALAEGADLNGFRQGLRRGIAQGVAPEAIVWQVGAEASLFGQTDVSDAAPVRVPRAAAALIDLVVCHRDPERYALLYHLVWRMVRGERALLEVHTDPLVWRLERMAKAIRRDLHKMHAFVRFRRIDDEAGERFIAWFEPEHFILASTADFFVKRYPSMRWSILTPDGSLHWDKERLTFGPPGDPRDAPAVGDIEGAWDVYFQSTFNPARLNVAQMQKEMPRKYWRNMPETKLIPGMLQMASSRVDEMISATPQPAIKRDPQKALAKMLDTEIKSLEQLNAIISASEPFVRGGRRAVIGEGPSHPDIAFVGEQPGDQEDIQGRPFVGPAGQLFDAALEKSGIDRSRCYVTNAVKHFKFEQRGKRRIHQTPTTGEVKHYRWWLMKELELVRPKLVVALGVTAALALSGKPVTISRARGTCAFGSQAGLITVHPSYLLRLPDEDARAEALQLFVRDLINAKASV